MKATLLSATALLLTCAGAHAGSAYNVTITHIEAEPQGHFFFYVSSPISNSPSCAAQPATGFVVDGSTAGGRVVVSLVVEAYALGKTLSMGGSNACDVHSGYETIGDIYTTN
jgi:hypothetical protein